ncbi:Kelch repeat-containing protein [Pyxidicoccus trucidator]|uniref:Kelch repeat-containing protein n=1 Tax=Pyxidicoccus trucidator TaxID=2709662 RepID=UPI0013DC7B40|nr:kelch motif-containing protein [Pyxidicoccus trucidator]
MNKTTTPLLLALSLAWLAGCPAPTSPPPTSSTGSAQLAVSVPQAHAASVSRVTVTASAADLPSVSVELGLSHGVWSGVLDNLAPGADRTFLARAFDASGTPRFEGSASGVVISPGQTSFIALSFQPVEPPPASVNRPPVIDSLVAASTSVTTGSALSLVATARDPDPGDTLSYAWSSAAGAFSSEASAATTWTAPVSPGRQVLTLTVTDAQGLAASFSLAIDVTPVPVRGDARISISFNTFPQVSAISVTLTQPTVGQTTTVSASAADLDGDSLSYSWTASCPGTWAQRTSSSARFTPSTLPFSPCDNCRLTVRVSDERGGLASGTVALCISPPPIPPHFTPIIRYASRSSDTAAPGQELTFEVMASDPEDSPLSFSWATNAGWLGGESTGTSTSRITWTAPSCVSTSFPPGITATVTNAFSLTATHSFPVTGLPACASDWSATGAMVSPRTQHTVTLLLDGKVLVTGGYSELSGPTTTTEVYDPASGTWSATGAMHVPRANHTATLLLDGKVLITGGQDTATAEVYDPASGTWSTTGSLAVLRFDHTATLLPGGKVLVSGGQSVGVTLAMVEVYDPASGTWSVAGSMASPRIGHAATPLPGGKVLVTGGYSGNGAERETTEVYDSASGTWSAGATMSSTRARHAATPLSDGKVLVSGGVSGGGLLATVEVYDPASDTWSTTASLSWPRERHTATPLSDGKVLVSGGGGNGGLLATAEVYDPASGTWSTTSSLSWRRLNHLATRLLNGKVLVSGGISDDSYLATAELYTP